MLVVEQEHGSHRRYSIAPVGACGAPSWPLRTTSGSLTETAAGAMKEMRGTGARTVLVELPIGVQHGGDSDDR